MAVIGFPNPVNEKAARVVAAGVTLLATATLVSGWRWLLIVLTVGFLARLLTGPRLSVLGQVATRLIAPRLGPPRFVPGPPKRFAQGIGLCVSASATIATLGFGLTVLPDLLLVVLIVFALLEAAVGFCAGCFVFGLLMRAGVIPEETCQACSQWTPAASG